MKYADNKTSMEYIATMIPEKLPNWQESWEEGYEIGKGIVIQETPFRKKYNVKNDVDYRLRLASEGKLSWKINMGLGSVEEQVAGLKAAEKFNEETGLHISFAHQLPKNIIGIPKDKRDNIPSALGFDLDKPEDWLKITMASTVQPIFADNHLGWPNAVFTTVSSLTAGSMYTGLFGLFHQVAPGCPDEVWNMNENIKALGIVAAKYHDKVVVNSNADDSMPAYFLDLASSLAWGMLERYIVTDLCKVRYSFSFGNFTSNLTHKAAMWLAASDTFKTDDQPGIGFIYPNTVDHWAHHIHSNYGFQIPEALLAILIEKRFKTGAAFLSVPITEKITVPTVQEMLDMTGACQRAEESAVYFEPLMDWSEIENLRDKIKKLSAQMYENIMNGLKEAGVDMTNPLEIMVVLKRIDPIVFEKMFHPSVANEGNEQIVPLMPAALWEKTNKQIVSISNRLDSQSVKSALQNKRICVVSGDIHYFGATVVAGVLRELGADVVDGGNQLEAIDVLDLADELGIHNICVSLHNGQAFHYAELLIKLAAERKKEYKFFMGGILTSFVNDDDKEPVDVTNLIKSMGVYVCKSVDELVVQLTDL
jgi:methylmalonyl-CoA mutase cobalamin-binding subunit